MILFCSVIHSLEGLQSHKTMGNLSFHVEHFHVWNTFPCSYVRSSTIFYVKLYTTSYLHALNISCCNSICHNGRFLCIWSTVRGLCSQPCCCCCAKCGKNNSVVTSTRITDEEMAIPNAVVVCNWHGVQYVAIVPLQVRIHRRHAFSFVWKLWHRQGNALRAQKINKGGIKLQEGNYGMLINS